MSAEHVEIVRRFLAPHDGEDILPRIRALLERFGPDPRAEAVLAGWAEDPGWRFAHPDLRWDTSATGMGSLACGPREVVLSWSDWVEGWTRYVYRIVQYRDLGDSVLTIADVEAMARGLPVEMKSFQVWEVRDGKVSAMRAFLSEQQALNAVGLEK
jgi:hypothetical protein